MIHHIKDNTFFRKKVILRLDLNVPLGKKNILLDDSKIISVKKTVQHLVNQEAKIIIISHFGRPKRRCQNYSFIHILNFLKEAWDTDIQFYEDIMSDDINKKISESSHRIFLCENIRFYEEEINNDKSFAQHLASLGDVYINDAFSCSHREHASIVGIPQYIPAFMGFSFAYEMKNLSNIFSYNYKNKILISGGGKASDKLKTIKELGFQMSKIIAVGKIGITLMTSFRHKSNGWSNSNTDASEQIYDLHRDKVVLPIDLVIKNQSGIYVKKKDSLADKDIIYDVGPMTTHNIANTLKYSNLVLWNGPAGLYERDEFSTSSLQIARIIAYMTYTNKIFSIVAGGDTNAIIKKAGLLNAFSYISISGGALLKFLNKGSIIGIDILKNKMK